MSLRLIGQRPFLFRLISTLQTLTSGHLWFDFLCYDLKGNEFPKFNKWIFPAREERKKLMGNYFFAFCSNGTGFWRFMLLFRVRREKVTAVAAARREIEVKIECLSEIHFEWDSSINNLSLSFFRFFFLSFFLIFFRRKKVIFFLLIGLSCCSPIHFMSCAFEGRWNGNRKNSSQCQFVDGHKQNKSFLLNRSSPYFRLSPSLSHFLYLSLSFSFSLCLSQWLHSLSSDFFGELTIFHFRDAI